ncbi:hypothetical protein AZF37_03640 [endosymbiont 'TC1' of Trimyema compressum]|nr:hypothetical protein AZF37_03640 [endosymbiont 'TC1' of Trimyema compressum]
MLSVLSTGMGIKLFTAEGNMERIMPNVGKSARMIMTIYAGYAIVGTILYVIAGIPMFEAINQSMAAVSTGGFSTLSDGIAPYENNMVYVVTVALMFLGSLGFGTHILLLRGHFKRFFKLSEVRFFVLLIGIAIVLLTLFGLNQHYNTIGEGLRISFFQAISVISSTGFNIMPVEEMPSFSILVIVLLMLIRGCIGATSGGVKVYRVLIMAKKGLWNISRYLKPERMVNENYFWRPEGKVYINHKLVSKSASYIFAFMTFYFI